jgi:outer membrane autotransporter protein
VLSFQFDSDVDSTPHAITMTTIRTPYANVVSGSNHDAIANYLQGTLAAASGDFEQMLVLLDRAPTAAALEQLLDEISPEVYGNFSGMSRAGINQYHNAITDRLNDLRGLAWLSSDKRYASNTLTDFGPVLADVPAGDADETWSVWASGYYAWADQDDDDDYLGFDYDTDGVVLGADVALNDNWTVGLSGGMASTDLDYDDINADSDVDTWHMGVYASYKAACYYVDAALSYADNDYDTSRNISFMGLNAEGDTEGEDISAYLGAGMKTSVDSGWTWTASVQYIDHQADSFTETGAGVMNLTVDEVDSESLVTALGFRWAGAFDFNDITCVPELRAQAAYEFGDTEDEVTARFAGSPAGTSFSVDGAEADEFSVLVGVGLTADVMDSLAVFVDYDVDWRDDFVAQMVSGGLRYSF